jgi:hypothetical protein
VGTLTNSYCLYGDHQEESRQGSSRRGKHDSVYPCTGAVAGSATDVRVCLSTSVRFQSLLPLDRLGVPTYSVQNACTKDIQAAAPKEARIEFLSLWAG